MRVSAYEDDGFIRVIIKDSGCGIPAEHLPNVKKKFYKANQNVRGNGIGLAVANEIMELHSGSLDIDSEEGMGTTVIITIPTMKKLEMNPELSNTTQIPTATAQVQVVERKQMCIRDSVGSSVKGSSAVFAARYSSFSVIG